MRVERPVSSTKIRRAGSRSGWASNQASRAAATSGRSCSAACAVFFPGDRPAIEEAPERPKPDRHAALGAQAILHFGQRDVVRLVDQGEQEALMGVELGTARATLALGLRLTGARNLCGPADHSGDADPVACGRLAARETGTDGVQDADAQIVAVGAGHGAASLSGSRESRRSRPVKATLTTPRTRKL